MANKIMTAVLDVAGLAGLSVAAGMWNLTAGIAAGGLSCLVLSWRVAK